MEDNNNTNYLISDSFVKEITRYICEKITLEETNFFSDKTKDQFRSLYRLIAERIRQYQNTATKPDLEKFQKKKEWLKNEEY